MGVGITAPTTNSAATRAATEPTTAAASAFRDAAMPARVAVSPPSFDGLKSADVHGPASPGYHRDKQVEWCAAEAADPPLCAGQSWYDNGATISGMVGRYLASKGTILPLETCFNDLSCADEPPPPPAR